MRGAELVAAGYAVTALADGRAYTDDIVAARPDIAVLDVMLPGRSGLALAADQREHTDTAIVS